MTARQGDLARMLVAAALLALLAPAAAPAATLDDAARAAASWIGRDLAASTARPSGAASWGTDVDAVLALVATGYGGDIVEAAVDRLDREGSSYLDGVPASQSGPAAKLAFALLVTGRDATQLPASGGGTRDLVASLRSSIQPSGRYGADTNQFGQALAVLALARTPTGVEPQAIAYLRSLQCGDAADPQHGGFGSSTGAAACGAVDADSTGIVVSALTAAGVPGTDPALADAAAWLQRQQRPDGSFATSMATTGNTNSTGLAAQAARGLGTPASVAVAESAAAAVRALQVTCASPLVAGEDPAAARGGFVVRWVGAVAYDLAGWDAALHGGISTGATTTWRMATTQAVLALPGVTGLAALDAGTIEAALPPAPACQLPPPPPTPPAPQVDAGPQASTTTPAALPAAHFLVRSAASPIMRGGRAAVVTTGLAPNETYAVTLSGITLATGRADAAGAVRTSVLVPRTFRTATRRVLEVHGSHAARRGAAFLTTVAPARLRVAAPRRPVAAGSLVRITVAGLVARERVRLLLAGRPAATSITGPSGATTFRVRMPRARTRTITVTACGVDCSRSGAARLQLVAR